MITLWHNPRCSKSRQALKLLEDAGAEVTVRRYLENPPTAEELRAALKALGRPALDLVRTGESAFREAGLTRDTPEAELIAAMAAQPILIERPLALKGGRAALGRPPERVLDLL